MYICGFECVLCMWVCVLCVSMYLCISLYELLNFNFGFYVDLVFFYVSLSVFVGMCVFLIETRNMNTSRWIQRFEEEILYIPLAWAVEYTDCSLHQHCFRTVIWLLSNPWLGNLQHSPSAFADFDEQSQKLDPINRLVMSSPSSYMIVPTVF